LEFTSPDVPVFIECCIQFSGTLLQIFVMPFGQCGRFGKLRDCLSIEPRAPACYKTVNPRVGILFPCHCRYSFSVCKKDSLFGRFIFSCFCCIRSRCRMEQNGYVHCIWRACLLYQFLKFSLFQGYRIYRFTFLTLGTKIIYIPKSMGSKKIRFTAFLTCIYDHKWKYPDCTLSMTLMFRFQSI
jgi:hypothetical protein